MLSYANPLTNAQIEVYEVIDVRVLLRNIVRDYLRKRNTT